MVNYSGNPRIAEYGRHTRFGNEKNCPLTAQRQANPPWSVRNATRRIASFTFPASIFIERSPNLDELLDAFRAAGEVITAAHIVAAMLWLRALEGDLKAMERVTKIVDGPC